MRWSDLTHGLQQGNRTKGGLGPLLNDFNHLIITIAPICEKISPLRRYILGSKDLEIFVATLTIIANENI